MFMGWLVLLFFEYCVRGDIKVYDFVFFFKEFRILWGDLIYEFEIKNFK